MQKEQAILPYVDLRLRYDYFTRKLQVKGKRPVVLNELEDSLLFRFLIEPGRFIPISNLLTCVESEPRITVAELRNQVDGLRLRLDDPDIDPRASCLKPIEQFGYKYIPKLANLRVDSH